MPFFLVNKNHFLIAGACATLFWGCLNSSDGSNQDSNDAFALRSPNHNPCIDPVQSTKPDANVNGIAKANGKGNAKEKAAICHIPPGNPANAHTLSISASAIQAHLDHGDKLGACKDPSPADCSPTEDETEGSNPTTVPDVEVPELLDPG